FHAIGLIHHHRRLWHQIEYTAIRAGNRCVEFPAGKSRYSSRLHSLLNDVLRSGDAFSRETGVNSTQQLLAHRRFGQRQQQRLVHRSGRALAGRVELANGLYFVTKELNAHGAVRFRGIDIENAAAQRILSRHLDQVGSGVANLMQLLDQGLDINRLGSAHSTGQVAVVLARAQPYRSGTDGRHDGRGRAGRKRPQRRRTLLLESGDNDPPRARFRVGGYTREGGNLFRVRKNLADERQGHRLTILAVHTWGKEPRRPCGDGRPRPLAKPLSRSEIKGRRTGPSFKL